MTQPTIEQCIAKCEEIIRDKDTLAANVSLAKDDCDAAIEYFKVIRAALTAQAGDKHGSGRTTRMLKHAQILERQGRAVYVIADTTAHAAQLQRLLPDDTGIKVETEGSVGNLDWMQISLRRAHPNCVVLIDHHAIETRFGKLLRMAHAYDNDDVLRAAIAAAKDGAG